MEAVQKNDVHLIDEITWNLKFGEQLLLSWSRIDEEGPQIQELGHALIDLKRKLEIAEENATEMFRRWHHAGEGVK